VLVRVRTAAGQWEHGIGEHLTYPGASVLKLAIALAVEGRFRHGAIDPDTRLCIAAVGVRDSDRSVLSLLDPSVTLSLADLVRLMLGSSDNASARVLASLVDEADVRSALRDTGCLETTVEVGSHLAAGITGMTSCADALALLSAVLDGGDAATSVHALQHSILSSRIPLGARATDVVVAHKTGTLPGLAHDVARLEADGGIVDVAFLSDGQHDTLVTGYAMGICTRAILEAWGLPVHRTTSVLGS
jgi:beta-lactamase class A